MGEDRDDYNEPTLEKQMKNIPSIRKVSCPNDGESKMNFFVVDHSSLSRPSYTFENKATISNQKGEVLDHLHPCKRIEKSNTVTKNSGFNNSKFARSTTGQSFVRESTRAEVSFDTDGEIVINEYKIIGELGKGAFGTVKLVVHIDDDTLFVTPTVLNYRQ